MGQLAVKYSGTGSLSQSKKVKQFLTFTLMGEQYGVDILRVQEIRGVGACFLHAQCPRLYDYIKGVLSLRGVIVPVIDLRQRFEMEPAEYTSSTVVIVLLLDAGDGEKIYGIVVNEVSNFIEVPEESVQPAPEFGVEMNKDYLTAITTLEDRMIMLLDANKIVLSTELDQLSEAV